MPTPSPLPTRWTVGALLTLTTVTGLIDAVSYLRLGRVFVANMTGNVVFLGFSLAPHSGLSALASIVAIGGFLVGAFTGGRLAHSLSGHTRRWLATAVGGQAVLIALVAVLTGSGALPFDGHGNLTVVAILAAAMGIQNSTVRVLGAPDLTTTVLTLTLTGLGADSSLAGGTGSKPQRRLGSVLAMLAGAAVGAALLQHSGSLVIALAAVGAAIVAAVFAFGPTVPAALPPS